MNQLGVCQICNGLFETKDGLIKTHSLPVDWNFKFGHLSQSEVEEIANHKHKAQKSFSVMVFPPDCEGSNKPPIQVFFTTQINMGFYAKQYPEKVWTKNQDGEVILKNGMEK